MGIRIEPGSASALRISTLTIDNFRKESEYQMNWKLIKSFLKDQIGYTYTYFIGNFMIGLFYYLTVGDRVEIFYPLFISIFVYLIYLIVRFYGYYKLIKGIEELSKYSDYQGNFHYELDRKIEKTIQSIHKEYAERISNLIINREKEMKFLSMWIHNMKTPITVNDLIIQRIETKDIDSTEGVPQIKEENTKLLNNLDMILNILRLEDFSKDYVPEEIDLIAEITNIVNKNKRLFIYNRVFPKVITELKEAYILSDLKWNELMLNQIISNGIKYSSEENVSKNLYFHIEKDGQMIKLTIRDEGIGIPEYDMIKIFDPFFTGDNGRKGYSSSGIGLYFCKEVATMLDHKLQITSKVGEGTSVLVSYLAKL